MTIRNYSTTILLLCSLCSSPSVLIEEWVEQVLIAASWLVNPLQYSCKCIKTYNDIYEAILLIRRYINVYELKNWTLSFLNRLYLGLQISFLLSSWLPLAWPAIFVLIQNANLCVAMFIWSLFNVLSVYMTVFQIYLLHGLNE